MCFNQMCMLSVRLLLKSRLISSFWGVKSYTCLFNCVEVGEGQCCSRDYCNCLLVCLYGFITLTCVSNHCSLVLPIFLGLLSLLNLGLPLQPFPFLTVYLLKNPVIWRLITHWLDLVIATSWFNSTCSFFSSGKWYFNISIWVPGILTAPG